MSDRITVIGNVASTPERRELPGGIPAISFRLASSERRLDNGQWVDAHTNWYWVSAYRKLAEHALDSLEKGQRVIVTGKFRVKQWESGGKSGSSAEIDAEAVGHDLMFGTTTFHKASGSTTAASGASTASAASPLVDASGWAVPGSAGTDAESRPAPNDAPPPGVTAPAEPGELVGVGAGGGGGQWSPDADDQTPF